MQIGLFTAHDRSLAEALAVWRRAEDVGLDAIGVVDSPLLMREATVALTALALQSSRVRIFPSVMNTLTRDPTVIAGAYLGLRDLAGDRVSLAFGAGDSSTAGVGLGSARLDHIAEFITTVRALVRGERAEYQGRTLQGAWHAWDGVEPRILMSAHGPKALAAAGRVADGVISGFGLLPETVAAAERIVRESAERAGRDPSAVELWHVAYYCPAETVQEGFVHANGGGAAVLARGGGLDGKLVPAHLQAAVQAVGETWTLETHARANHRALEVATATGSLDYLVQRAGGLIGPVDLGAGLADIEALGVERLLVVALGSDKMRLVGGIGEALATRSRRDTDDAARTGVL